MVIHVTGSLTTVHSQSKSLCCVFWRKDSTPLVGDVSSPHSCDKRCTESLTQLCNQKSAFTIRICFTTSTRNKLCNQRMQALASIMTQKDEKVVLCKAGGG